MGTVHFSQLVERPRTIGVATHLLRCCECMEVCGAGCRRLLAWQLAAACKPRQAVTTAVLRALLQATRRQLGNQQEQLDRVGAGHALLACRILSICKWLACGLWLVERRAAACCRVGALPRLAACQFQGTIKPPRL